MLLRRKYLYKRRFVRRIQRFVRRSRIIFAWQEAVYSVLEIAHDAATIVQCWLRRAAAQRLLQRLKDEYERAHFVYGHDFTLSEEANWAAFGLTSSGDDDHYREELCRRPVVQVSTHNRNPVNSSNVPVPSEATQSMERVVPRMMLAPAAGEVLRLIEFPPPPPGCLFQAPNDPQGGERSVFCMMDRSSTEGSQYTSELPVPLGQSNTDGDSFIQQLVVRRFISDDATVPQAHVDSTVGGVNYTAGIMPAKKTIDESELLTWRLEHLGDILSESSVDLPSDSFYQKSGTKDLYKDSLNRTAPIYARLARKFL